VLDEAYDIDPARAKVFTNAQGRRQVFEVENTGLAPVRVRPVRVP
jgi:hypothetical protein